MNFNLSGYGKSHDDLTGDVEDIIEMVNSTIDDNPDMWNIETFDDLSHNAQERIIKHCLNFMYDYDTYQSAVIEALDCATSSDPDWSILTSECEDFSCDDEEDYDDEDEDYD